MKKNNFTAILIDDETHSRSVLNTMLQRYCRQIKVVGETDDMDEAIRLIKTVRPEIIFLDIELGQSSGFDLLEALDYINFQIIFVTAFDTFAIKAIKWSAQDYLLKPVDPAELVNAVVKTTEKINKGIESATAQVNTTTTGVLPVFNQSTRIALPCMDGLKFFDTNDIIRCEAVGGYTKFYLINRKEEMVSKTLKDYEELLEPWGFLRVHHSFVVNTKHVVEYVKGRGGSIIMSDGMEIDISVRKKEEFLKKFLRM